MITRTIIRLLAYDAIKGRTSAGDMVEDSAIDNMVSRITADGEAKPVIVIYTEEQADQAIELVFEVFIASKAAVKNGEGEDELTISSTGDGFEFFLDVIENQICRLLKSGQSEAAQLFRTVSGLDTVYQHMSKRGSSVENGPRFAARQITITLPKTLPAPAAGGIVAGSIWADVITYFEAHPDHSPFTAVIAHELAPYGEPTGVMQDLIATGLPKDKAGLLNLLVAGTELTGDLATEINVEQAE